MGMRITTSMMMNTYRYNLQGSTGAVSDAREKVLTGRKFTSYAEDPFSATQAWRIRRAMSQNFNYQSNNSDTYSRFSIAWTTKGTINDQLELMDGKVSSIRGTNGAIGAGRQPLGQVLSESAETIIQCINSAKYGDHFVFAGNDEMNPPFTWNADKTILYYRGVNVGAGGVEKPLKPDWAYDVDENGIPKTIPPVGTGKTTWENAWIQYYNDQTETEPKGFAMPEEVPAWVKSGSSPKDILDNAPDPQNAWDEEWIKYYEDLQDGLRPEKPTANLDPSEDEDKDIADKWGAKDQFGIPANAKKIMEDTTGTYNQYDKDWAAYLLDQGELAKLNMLAAEEQNVDLGMGLREDENGKLVNGTVFNRSLPGINFLGGYGVDEDGDPKNMALLMKRLGEIFSNSDPNSGAWPEPAAETEAEAYRLLDKIKSAHDRNTDSYAEIETRSHFLQNNQNRLEMQGDYLQEERVNLEQVDLADAITEFSWDYYCYSAALKVGTQLLSQSLLDYMG